MSRAEARAKPARTGDPTDPRAEPRGGPDALPDWRAELRNFPIENGPLCDLSESIRPLSLGWFDHRSAFAASVLNLYGSRPTGWTHWDLEIAVCIQGAARPMTSRSSRWRYRCKRRLFQRVAYPSKKAGEEGFALDRRRLCAARYGRPRPRVRFRGQLHGLVLPAGRCWCSSRWNRICLRAGRLEPGW